MNLLNGLRNIFLKCLKCFILYILKYVEVIKYTLVIWITEIEYDNNMVCYILQQKIYDNTFAG